MGGNMNKVVGGALGTAVALSISNVFGLVGLIGVALVAAFAQTVIVCREEE